MIRPLYKEFEKDYIDFWKLLGVSFGESKETITKKYQNFQKNNKYEIDEYYVAWKLLSDKYFEKLYKKNKSIKETYDAGFFLDSLDLNEDCGIQENKFLSNPLNKIGKLKKDKNIILISTGGFSPVHDGHIHTLEIAKKELEKKGYNIVGGYLSPSHDHYVSTKDNGKAHNPALNRIKMCNEKTQDSNWIMTSPHESIYNRTSINYTDVIENMKNYMKVHVSKDIIIGYVFGGDNAPFIKAFEDTESIAICVSRNHERESFINKENLKNYNYIYIKDNPYSNISSTKIRNKQIKIKQEKEKSNNFLIRNDYNMFNFPKEDSPLEEFKKLFKKSLTNSNIYDICVEDQYISAENLKKYDKNKKISLDVYVKGDYNISLSRLFNHSDSQIKASSLVSRPEEESIDFKLLPSGDYTLVEDDVVSGFTLKHLKSKLPKNVILKDLIILSKLSKVNTDFYDVVDLRDFIIGTNFSGLVVDIYGTHVRVPYMYPYVDLTTRASIKPEYALKFTKEMLNINIKFYKKLKEKNIEVSSNKSIIFLMDLIGIKKNISNIDNIINFCEWHLDKIKKVTRT